MKKFYGKYRGEVTDNQDPLMLGRIKASVPAVLESSPSGWAYPCMPFGGDATGFFALPAVGARVWIEFEQGDPRKPIWSGCFWGNPTEVPPILLAPPYKKVLLQTQGGHSVMLDDTPGIGGITLAAASGENVTLTAQGITLKTATGVELSLSPIGIEMKTTTGDGLTVAAQGITLQTAAGASVKLAATAVSINGTALVVQ